MQRKWLRYLKTPLGGGVTLLAVFFLSSGFYLNFTKHVMPGHVSAVQRNGEPISGYASHAMFEQDCAHCHAPVHCVTSELCQDCHIEIAQQRAEAIGLHGLLPGTDRCQNCHVEHQGRDAVISMVAFANIDHEAIAGFNLDKHEMDYDKQPLNCESCHTEGRFGADTVDCVSCHTDDDTVWMAEHSDLYGDDCLECHDGHDRLSAFEHNQIYLLEGAHETAVCADCHPDHTFVGTPDDCASCHEFEAKHTEIFGFDCARCHSVTAWVPAQLTQHTFQLEHGDEGKLECQSCHIATYYDPTCSGCHDDEQMVTDHDSDSLNTISECAECHPTGVTAEAERLGFNLPILENQ